MGFGTRLREARDAKKLSGTQLGEKLGGVAKQTIAHWEKDRYQPSLEQLVKLTEILGVSFDFLLLGKTPENLSIGAIQQAKMYEKLDTEDRRKWEVLRSTIDATDTVPIVKNVTPKQPSLQVVQADTRLTQSDTGPVLAEEVATRTKARQRVKRVSTEEQERKNRSGGDGSPATGAR